LVVEAAEEKFRATHLLAILVNLVDQAAVLAEAQVDQELQAKEIMEVQHHLQVLDQMQQAAVAVAPVVLVILEEHMVHQQAPAVQVHLLHIQVHQ
jgi:hypothetical protein